MYGQSPPPFCIPRPHMSIPVVMTSRIWRWPDGVKRFTPAVRHIYVKIINNIAEVLICHLPNTMYILTYTVLRSKVCKMEFIHMTRYCTVFSNTLLGPLCKTVITKYLICDVFLSDNLSFRVRELDSHSTDFYETGYFFSKKNCRQNLNWIKIWQE